MSEHLEHLKEVKSKLSLSQAIERPWKNISYEENIEQIAILSCHEDKPVKAETNSHGTYVLIPAKSNIVDTELSFIEQRDELKSATDEKLLNDWKEICEDQKQSVVGDHLEMLGIAVSKEMFSRNSELREQIDLPQTLRLYNVLKQSRNQENKALLPEIEKDLQTKAWHYFASEIEYGENPKKFRSTPYSASCVEELKEFMIDRMHAPEDVITPKLELIETSMMSAIYTSTLQSLTPKARNLVYNTALKYPKHGSSERIIENINIGNGERGLVR
ncbi:MAG: hypothetical protein E7019_01945 [Alphaproteobacteria bacterium]|nr:hypothetical protein [Alphaproteobacteria bacterium]